MTNKAHAYKGSTAPDTACTSAVTDWCVETNSAAVTNVMKTPQACKICSMFLGVSNR